MIVTADANDRTCAVWIRAIFGLVLLVVGAVWIGQGSGLIKGSGMMSGHGGYAALGAVVAIIGAGLLFWAIRIRQQGELVD